jgi:membrane protease YdiL (CAAX protease family)
VTYVVESHFGFEVPKSNLNQDSTPAETVVAARPLTAIPFLVGLLVILVCSYSQYVIPGLNFVSAVLLVYGIPILVTGLIWGRAIIKKAFNQTLNAVKFGLGYFGAFTALGLVMGIFIIFLLTVSDPAAVNLLQKPNPVLQVSPGVAWLMVGVSFLVTGPAEESLFRGYVFGGVLSFFRNRHWLSLALVSSIFFAAAHLYYGVVYGAASLVPFADLTAFGMAMAATYYVSGGNLIVPALIHGAYDATGFIGVATSSTTGDQLRELMILIGIFVAIAIFVYKKMNNPWQS